MSKLKFTYCKEASFYLCGVDRFSKVIHFIPYIKATNASRVLKLYFDEMVKLYGLLQTIILDKDVRFMSSFWKILWHMMGIGN
ncbi:hypothetical protein Peur_044929 [Populus x canadensis]